MQLSDLNVIRDFKFAFRKKHSTTQQIMWVLERAILAIKKGEHCGAMFFYFAKAFDYILWPGLTYMLLHCHVRIVDEDVLYYMSCISACPNKTVGEPHEDLSLADQAEDKDQRVMIFYRL